VPSASAITSNRSPDLHVHLETDRLLLRHFTEEDADELVALNSDPEVMRYLGGVKPAEETRDDILPAFLEYHRGDPRIGFFAAIERWSGGFVGWFHLRPEHEPPYEMELGYRLKRSAWGKGYGTEGSRALIAKAFEELGVDRVVATADEDNTRSRRVMEKAGMRLVGHFVFHDAHVRVPAVRYAIDRRAELT
jgi:RimJ/RimL family protein N-acetyltransferase